MYKTKQFLLFSLFLLLHFHLAYGRQPLKVDISVLKDSNGVFDATSAFKQQFAPLPNHTPNYGLSKSVYWLKIKITDTNRAANRHLNNHPFLMVHNGIITSAILYDPANSFYATSSGDLTPYSEKTFNTQFVVFKLSIPDDSSATYLLRLYSDNVLDLPIKVDDENIIFDNINKDQLFFGLYLGIIVIMFFYNLFIYFTVRDVNYLYYVMYILTVGMVQACLKGYSSKLFWRDNTWLTLHMTNFSLALSGIFSIFFVFNFLNLKKYSKGLYYALWVIAAIYGIGIFINFGSNYILAQQIMQGNASLVAITIMSSGIVVYRKGFKPANFFNISWSFFLTGVIVYILKDAGVLPYNTFTSNSILIGSGLEVSLLSFALADKINTYRKEKETYQAEALSALRENERIIREQNVILETKVTERTHELKIANEDLNTAMYELKEAQSQLVESEKMASLGQLTAGIAHEINNPINFVTSNVKPLNRDVHMLLDTIGVIEQIVISDASIAQKQQQIEEYKNEIDFDYLKMEISQLLHGIGDGASRTAEIVKGLRIFSRLDEDDLKKADINEGLDSTLIIVNNLLGNTIKIVKNYGNLPMIECYPGKLNQVFLNIISNGIYAIKKKYSEMNGGLLTITTGHDERNVFINIADNGTGMDENTKKRLFEPFFTTKDVGEGTGLGLSIAYNTIAKHNGHIDVNSEIGIGTEFILTLPLIQK